MSSVSGSATSQPAKAAKAMPAKLKTAAERADALKTEGNALYAKRNFPAALAKYTEAQKTDPRPVFLSNMAAARFEMGDYFYAAQDARDCEAMLVSQGKLSETALRTKNALRRARALLFVGDYADAIEVANAVRDAAPADAAKLIKDAEDLLTWAKATQGQTRSQLRENLVSDPWYRHKEAPLQEYYSIGHDHAISIFSGRQLLNSDPPGDGDIGQLETIKTVGSQFLRRPPKLCTCFLEALGTGDIFMSLSLTCTGWLGQPPTSTPSQRSKFC